MKEMGDGRFYQIAAASFEAARVLTCLPPAHPAGRMHGHSFLARVAVSDERESENLGERLVKELARCVGCLDYRLLNEQISLPTDLNLAHWISECLQPLAPMVVGVRSAHNQGVELDRTNCAHFWYRNRFEAAHRLPHVALGHPCGRMHGHGFEVTLHATEYAIDSQAGAGGSTLASLVSAWHSLQEILDGSCLNHITGLENPTSEVLADWIWQRIKPQLPTLTRVSIQETATSFCQYDGATYHIGKAFCFESALHVDASARLHGHSYQLRLHLSAPLDVVMGWTVDYGDVKKYFEPVYLQLDHRRINDLAGLVGTDIGSIAHWIRDQTSPFLPHLSRVDLEETPHRGVVLTSWDDDPARVLQPWPTR